MFSYEHGNHTYSCNVENPVRKDGKLYFRVNVEGRVINVVYPDYVSKPPSDKLSDEEKHVHGVEDNAKRREYLDSLRDQALRDAIGQLSKEPGDGPETVIETKEAKKSDPEPVDKSKAGK